MDPKYQLWCAIVFVASIQGQIHCRTYKVGDLDGWGIPMSANPQVYTKWSTYHNLTVGDSLFFLYPPSQDSVIQVTKGSYDTCNLKDPILQMNNGNSLFNITRAGNFYFTSGVDGHCGKSQKLHVFVSGNGTYADSPENSPGAEAPAYPTVFGSIPVQGANSTSSSVREIPGLVSAAAAVFMAVLVMVY